MDGTSKGKKKTAFVFGLLAIGLVAAISFFGLGNLYKLLTSNTIKSEDLETIPANQWIHYHQPFNSDFRRQSHAGIAYDTKRKTIYIFGSDTHGYNWDNSVHEFNPETKTWTKHYSEAEPSSYKIDNRGVGVSYSDRALPWAMHSYDNVIYDPTRDALVVTAKPWHNPITKSLGKPTLNPAWFYIISLKAWGTLETLNPPFPNNFAGSSAYDPERQVIISYGSYMAELDAVRNKWRKVPVSKPHGYHHNMEYDSVRKKFYVFGDNDGSNTVWAYSPGRADDRSGSWEEIKPGGDYCPPDQHFPVAYDKHNKVFLLVPDNNPKNKTSGNRKATSSSTFIFDPTSKTYQKLPSADMPALSMNYMMVYDSHRKVFFLITGGWEKPPVVWVLRLEPSSL